MRLPAKLMSGCGDLAGPRVQVVEQVAEVAGKIVVSPPKTDAGRRMVAAVELRGWWSG